MIAGSHRDTDRQLAASRADTDRQLAASRQEIRQQLGAARDGRAADRKADAYALWLTVVSRHLASLGGPEEGIRTADRELFAAVSRVQLLGSPAASAAAVRMASRARRMTNAGIQEAQGGPRSRSKDYFVQQVAQSRFVDLVRSELRS